MSKLFSFMLYIVNIMTFAFSFMNRFYGKSGLLNMIIFPFLHY